MTKKKKILIGVGVAWVLGVLLVLAMFIIAYNDLPKFSSLQDYQPAIGSQVFARDGRVIGEFHAEERRYVLPVTQLPKVAVDAFVSGEDDRFFEHGGVDFLGILRALFADIKAGGWVQGGSTITQQVAKALLQNSRRTLSRKFKEVILAGRLESNLKKEQILYLYLNHIYLGFGSYGLEAASRAYFHKSSKDLTIAEAALLAGLAKAPTRFSPHSNPADARRRQVYVLGRMQETGKITKDQYEKSLHENIKIFDEHNVNEDVAPYYLEYVRQMLVEKYGTEKVYEGGLSVQVAADYDLSVTGADAVRRNLHDLDKRQGYRGPLKQVAPDKDEMLVELEKIRNEVFSKKFPFRFIPTEKDPAAFAEVKKYTYQKAKELGLFKDDRELLTVGETYPAIVVRIENDRKAAVLLIGGITARLEIGDMSWAKRIRENEVSNGQTISFVTDAIKRGDEILVQVKKIPELKPGIEGVEKTEKEKQAEMISVALDQIPLAQSALFSMEANTGYVSAMVGGYSFKGSEYNRVLQAARQPGSSFKPFVYAAALDKGFSPASIIVDSPIIFENQGKDDLKWIPENHSEKFYGDTTLRMALMKSRNVPTVKLLQEIQIPYFLDYAQNLGIRKGLTADLSVALGSSAITLMDLTRTYAIFPRNGLRMEPVFLLKVTDRDGKVLYQHDDKTFETEIAMKWQKIKDEYDKQNNPDKAVKSPEEAAAGALGAADAAKSADGKQIASDPSKIEGEDPATGANKAEVSPNGSASLTPEERLKMLKAPRFDDPLRAMDSRTAYVLGSILRDAVLDGTGKKASILKRRIGGKTGTTSEYVDAWFMGFSPELVTGVWVGFDNPRTLGAGETGARAALPAWINYMQTALKSYQRDEYEVPKGIVFVRINPEDGSLAGSNNPNAVKVAFVEGTEPTVNKRNSQVPDSSEFFKEDY